MAYRFLDDYQPQKEKKKKNGALTAPRSGNSASPAAGSTAQTRRTTRGTALGGSAATPVQLPQLKAPQLTKTTTQKTTPAKAPQSLQLPEIKAFGAAQPAGTTRKAAAPKAAAAPLKIPEIRAFGAGDYSKAGKGLERAAKTVAAGAVSAASGLVEIAGQFRPTTGQQSMGQFSGFGDLGRAVRENRETGISIEESTRRQEAARRERQKADQQRIFDTATRMAEKGQQYQQEAKEGLGTVGQFLVDMGVTGTQMAGDALANLVLPGSGLAMMGMRSYGQAAGEARREGKDSRQQFLAGLKSAGIEVFTEKMFGAFSKVYGGAAADELIEKMVKKLTGNASGQALLTWMVNAAGEGVEEVTSDLLNPLADRLLGLDDGKGAIYSTDDLAQWGYDFLLGTAMGALGGGQQLAQGVRQGRAQAAENSYYDDLRRNGLGSAGAAAKAQKAGEAFRRVMPARDGVTLRQLRMPQLTTYAERQAAEYRGEKPRNVSDPRIGRLELSSEKYNPSGADVSTVYGNRYRQQVKEDAIRRMGISDGKPAYLLASNITKNGQEYYVDVTKASLNKLLYTREHEMLPLERILLVDNLEKAIDNSYWAESNGDRKSRPQIDGFDTLRTSFYVDGIPYYADVKVKVVQGKNGADPQNVVYFLEPEEITSIKRVDAPSPTEALLERNIVFRDGTSTVETSVPQSGTDVNTQGVQDGREYAAAPAAPLQMPRLVDEQGRTYDERLAWQQIPESRRAAFDEAQRIAQRFGARVVASEQEGVNGSYRDGVIALNPYAADPVRQTLIHELTHHMESSGLYGDFRDMALRYVAEDMGADVDSMRQAVMTDYAQNGAVLDEDGATREIVAKFAGEKLFTDEDTVRRLLAEDRNLFQRIYDWLRDALTKLTGTSEERFLRNAEKLYAKALREATAESGRSTQMLFAGGNARTANTQALARAEALEAGGMTPENIRRETGWFRGMDGKWRFEIDDSGMEYRRDGDARLMEESGYRRLQELTDKWARNAEKQGEPLTAEELAESNRLENAYSDRVWSEKYELADFLRHSDLYDAYPQLQHTSVVFKEMQPGVNGYYDKAMDAVVLSKDLMGSPERTLLHEIQHVIQSLEGFTSGASPTYWKYKNRDGQGYRSDRQYMEAEKRLRDAFEAMPDTVQEEVRQINRVKLDQNWDEALRLEEGIYNSPYAELYSEYTNADFDRRARIDLFKNAVTLELYKNTAGEIEARDAASRRSYDAERRRLRMPDLGSASTVFADDSGAAHDINPFHRNAVEQWNREGRPEGETFILGSTGSVLQGLGAMESDIYMQGDKINRILQDHPEMTLEEIKRLPEILEDPVLVLKSKGSGRVGKTSRVVMFGTVRAQNGQPIMAVLDLRPYENGFLVTDMQKVNSSYTKKNPADFISSSEVLYADGKRAAPLLRLTGLTLTSQQLLQNGSVGSISYAGNDVNIEGAPFSDMTSRTRYSTGRGLEEMAAEADRGLQVPRLTTYAERTRAETERDKADVREQVRQMDAAIEAAAAEAVQRRIVQEHKNREMPEALQKLGVAPFGSEADYAGVDGLAKEMRWNGSARRKMQQQISKIPATEKERAFARQLADGTLDEADIPSTVDRETVEQLADYYRTMDNAPEAMLLRQRRAAILDRETAKMEPLLGMEVAYDEGGFRENSRGDRKPSGKIAKATSTLRRNLQTPARICATEWGTAHGKKVYEALFYPVTENNARQIDWVNAMLDRVRTFKDSEGKDRALNRKERELVQKIVEYQAAEKRVAAFDEQYRGAVDDVRSGGAAADAAKEFGIDPSYQEYQDLQNYQTYLRALEELRDSKSADSAVVNEAVRSYSTLYRELYDGINSFLVAHGYQPIGFIEGYAPHMQPEAEKTAFSKALKMLGLDDTAMSLPTSISGKTADLKPYKQYNPFFQERHGVNTEYDIAKGFENYVYYLGNIFYHTDDVMRIRAAEKYIRKTYSSEEASEQISWAENARNFPDAQITDFLRMNGVIQKGTELAAGDARVLLDEYIGKLYDQIGNVTRYSEMAKYLDNYANRLAGKQNMADRGAEAAAGRGSLNWINTLTGKYGGAKLAFNFSSALNQTSQLPMVAAENGEVFTGRAIRDFFRKDSAAFVQESNFLKGKRGINWLLGPETGLEKFKEKGFAMTEMVDSFTSYVAVRSKYLKELRAGKDHAEAMKLADEYGRSVMGSRARGEKPMLFDTKNPFWQIVTRFQLEALNSWEHVSRDLPAEIRQMARERGKTYAAGVAGVRVAKYLGYAFILNLAIGALSGGSPVPYDVAGSALEAIGKSMGVTKLTVVDDILEKLIDTRLFGTDGGDDDTERDWWAFLGSLVGDVMNDVPIIGQGAALLGIGDQTLPVTDLSKVGDFAKSIKNNGFTMDTLDKGWTAAGEFVFGGNQARKTLQGGIAVGRGGVYSKDRLRYQVEQTPMNYIKGLLFGRSALNESQEYYAERTSDFSEKQTEAFRQMQDRGVSAKASYDLLQKLRGIEKTEESTEAELRRDALRQSAVSGAGKWVAYYQTMAGEKELEAMDAVQYHSEADYGTVTNLLMNLKGQEKDVDKMRLIDRSHLTDEQKASLYKSLVAENSDLEKINALKATGITDYQYLQYKIATSGLTKKEAKLNAINTLDLTTAQKDALYYLNSYASSTHGDAPWVRGMSAADSTTRLTEMLAAEEDDEDDTPKWRQSLNAYLGEETGTSKYLAYLAEKNGYSLNGATESTPKRSYLQYLAERDGVSLDTQDTSPGLQSKYLRELAAKWGR